MKQQPNHEWLSKKLIAKIVTKRNPFSHKGDYGHALIVAGSFGKMGAAVLAAKACLRSGVGLLSMHIPKCGYPILQTAIPEAMVICDAHESRITTSIPLDGYTALAIGPGIGTSKETAIAIKQMIENFHQPIVIDADAINILSTIKTWLKLVPAQSIFTPHPKEFERLVGKAETDEAINKLQIRFSKKYNVFVILKGHHTCISCPDGKCYINTTGNAGMAKAGNGDALTGILIALLAQHYTPEQACMVAVYLHGLAGDIAVKETGEFSLLASDLIDNIGKAFLKTVR